MKLKTKRFFNTFAHCTFKKRKTEERYRALVAAGYISKRALPFLLKYRAKIDTSFIKHVEEAMGFKLYNYQKEYLTKKTNELPDIRRSGRTTIHMIKLALSSGEPLRLSRPQLFSDYGDGSMHYALYYRQEFLRIRKKLIYGGLKVRDLRN